MATENTKNLFLRNKKFTRYFLLIIQRSKRADLKKFGSAVGEKKITFTNTDDLKKYLD
ncbi:MAG: hypothetical protein COT92_03035 [Candidatus Doudnabacteria bacterium CG10_big_fil_rev_8_21_14_0_10_42_18]|uniref:YbaK/aminoacyl-tRNA synthetase-associated domain-containing protein n=1 Tax=Candidatus Doudnabacteria bacterium CG10_big_fil_rev_8_21_14_0_10_42_18 TaxID=1974552 RepID=A0A2H0VAF5_9BACT|nr:MAG: hypothetical protein COT92_03035 [Candidatus Doudnabacteria bacterium CG10_big_fil_rev_8_21_14_0_10_42_18]